MACPFFMPVARLENGTWPHPARLPLGGGWCGHCTAPGHENEVPTQDVLEAFCNLGYATGCAWSPAERSSDAVRFAVSAPLGVVRIKPTAASTLVLRYVFEKDHRPSDHGELEFDLVQSAWLRGHHDPRIQKMAECFLDAYMKKKPPEDAAHMKTKS